MQLWVINFIQPQYIVIFFIGSRDGRLMAYSLLVPKFRFKDLVKFNAKQNTSARLYPSLEDVDDNEDGTYEKLDVDPNDLNVRFNPPITYHFHRKAEIYYRENGYGNAPVVKKTTHRWRYDWIVCCSTHIIDICSLLTFTVLQSSFQSICRCCRGNL